MTRVSAVDKSVDRCKARPTAAARRAVGRGRGKGGGASHLRPHGNVCTLTRQRKPVPRLTSLTYSRLKKNKKNSEDPVHLPWFHGGARDQHGSPDRWRQILQYVIVYRIRFSPFKKAHTFRRAAYAAMGQEVGNKSNAIGNVAHSLMFSIDS